LCSIHHARCWTHSRRPFFEALTAEPTGAAEASEQIKTLYAIEESRGVLPVPGRASPGYRGASQYIKKLAA
jgi:hypothetical protein